jgi:transcriptional regulator with PAS, ATPase and Fis domain
MWARERFFRTKMLIEELASELGHPLLNQEVLVIPVGEKRLLEAVEKLAIAAVLATTRKKGKAAQLLGIDPATLYRKRQKYHL